MKKIKINLVEEKKFWLIVIRFILILNVQVSIQNFILNFLNIC